MRVCYRRYSAGVTGVTVKCGWVRQQGMARAVVLCTVHTRHAPSQASPHLLFIPHVFSAPHSEGTTTPPTVSPRLILT